MQRQDLKQTAQRLNVLARFCGVRDIDSLTPQALQRSCNIRQADVLILFGGSIGGGFDVAAQGFLRKIAKCFMLVGGQGHTTETLRQKVQSHCAEIAVQGKSEAEIMAAYIGRRYGIRDFIMEMQSTNCGNNVTNALHILEARNISHDSVILVQDATMQRRMAAGFAKFAPDAFVVNFAAYQAELDGSEERLQYRGETLWGMWDVERYISLLMGEIPRLTDDADGYGPNGRNYIAHVDVPQSVAEAFAALKAVYGDKIRQADDAYRSR